MHGGLIRLSSEACLHTPAAKNVRWDRWSVLRFGVLILGSSHDQSAIPRRSDLSAEGSNPYVLPFSINPARGLAIAAAVVAVVWAVLEVVEATLAYAAQDDYLEASRRGEKAYEVWTSYDLMGIPWIAVALVAYVVTSLWLYQVRSNLEIMRPDAEHARRKGWVWAGWLVPVVSLWFPLQVVSDILKGLQAKPSTTLLGGWWTAWLLTLLTSQIGPQMAGLDDIDTDAVRRLGDIEGTNAAFTLIAVVLWLMIIWRIAKAQDRAVRALTEPTIPTETVGGGQ